ncbi:MAG TPA: acetyl-CoA hydrolase/transferase C-terminal domain-containing protein [Candidatus Margulisiibacteriota bacterium]|nr:acetyl-CoA hydrolase/transferase C-terminal domain-containing protein [Candidatus Margulisiibacteriota bacterium]
MAARPTHGDAQMLYHSKLRTLREAVDLIRVDDTLAAPIATGQPAMFLNALGARGDYRNLTIFTGLIIEPYPVLQQPGVHLISGFYGPIDRMLKAMGANVQYLPADFLGWERYARLAAPRVVVSALAPMDAHGYLNFGLHAGASFNAFLDAAHDPDRLAIGEVNPSMPHVLGLGRYGGNRIHVSEIDCIVESDRPVFELPEQPVSDEDRAIAEHVEKLIDNGATLQIGIGGVPNIVAQLLAAGKKGDFGIHTEMMVDGIMHLHQAGKVTNHKGVYDGFSVATFGAGSRALYQWIDHNPEVRMLPVAQVNDPAIIRLNRRMVSINGALAVDLSGQVMADTLGPRQYSGVGGHELFVIGAHDSDGGKSIICLHSTATVAGQTVSTIVKQLPGGTPVSTPRHHVQYIVTEYGVANLGMLTDVQRAQALSEIAHPDFRDELRAAGGK